MESKGKLGVGSSSFLSGWPCWMFETMQIHFIYYRVTFKVVFSKFPAWQPGPKLTLASPPTQQSPCPTTSISSNIFLYFSISFNIPHTLPHFFFSSLEGKCFPHFVLCISKPYLKDVAEQRVTTPKYPSFANIPFWLFFPLGFSSLPFLAGFENSKQLEFSLWNVLTWAVFWKRLWR